MNNIEVKGIENIGNIKCTSTNSAITKEDGNYFLIPKHTGIDTVRLFKGKTKIFETTFDVKTIGDMEVQIAGTFDTVMSIARIIAVPFVGVKIPKIFYNFRAEVTRFEMTILKKGTTPIHFAMTGYKITEVAQNEIKTLKQGEKILFEGITAIPNDGYPRRLYPKVILIK